MRLPVVVLNACCRPRLISSRNRPQIRCLLTLAIETSCDDTSVAVLETRSRSDGPTSAVLHFHKKITSNNTQYHGVHPLASLYSHQENLAKLVDEAILHLPPDGPTDVGSNSSRAKKLPDFISVTRGPGMRSNLFTGIDTAKGLAAAWQIDLVGVHHMQAHALTPRLVAALQHASSPQEASSASASLGNSAQAAQTVVSSLPCTQIKTEPGFPFLSVLASGGHTLLIHSASLTEHRVMASTGDVAVGECLDKVARAVLPTQLLLAAKTTMYGAILEKFAFSHDPGTGPAKNGVEPGIASPGKNGYFLEDSTAKEYQAMYTTRYAYTVPKNHEDALRQNLTTWGWSFNQPLAKAGGGTKNKSLEMSFSGLMTAVERAVRFTRDPTTGKLSKLERPPEGITLEERKDMAREAMRAAFEHVASRVVLGLQQLTSENPGTAQVATVVVSGGVAANSYLRYILASMLVAHGYPDVRIVFPPVSLCTDNAAMIAWAGIEMYQAGYTDPRSIRGIRKWPLDQLLSPPQE